jgi:hypothetical protein
MPFAKQVSRHACLRHCSRRQNGLHPGRHRYPSPAKLTYCLYCVQQQMLFKKTLLWTYHGPVRYAHIQHTEIPVPLNDYQILENLGQLPYTLLNKMQRVAFATILFKCVVMFPQILVRLIGFNSISCTMLHTSIDATLQDTYMTLVLGVCPGTCLPKLAYQNLYL